MENIKTELKNFRIDEEDIEKLKELKDVFEKYHAKFSDEFYDSILELEGATKFFPDDATIERHKEALSGWFLRLFSGEYDNSYMTYLRKVGNEHVKIGVSVHFLSAAMCMVRGFCYKYYRTGSRPYGKKRFNIILQ